MTDVIPVDRKPFYPHPAGTDAENALLRWAYDHEILRVDLVANGRYKIVDPETHKNAYYTRMSTLAKTLDDSTGLEKWKQNNVIRGLKKDATILDEVTEDEFSVLQRASWRAGLRGGDELKADLGTAMHTALEVWVNDPLGAGTIPAPYGEDLTAIIAALRLHGITLYPEWVEVPVFHPDYNAAGRLDALVHGNWGDEWRVLDLKTGSLEYGIKTWSGQLNGYATAPLRWTPDRLVDMPPRDTKRALILHAPIGTGTCHVYELDIEAGGEIMAQALRVRQMRTGGKDLLIPLAATTPVSASPILADDVPAEPGSPTAIAEDAQRTDWLTGRIATLKGNTAAMAATRTVWPSDLPVAPPWTPEQQDAVNTALSVGEAAITAPFPEVQDPATAAAQAEEIARRVALRPDPANVHTLRQPANDDATVSESTASDARQSARALPAEQSATFRTWLADGKRAHRGWQPGQTGRCGLHAYACTVAATACINSFAADPYVEADVDTLTRAAWHLVTHVHPQPAWATGALIGALDADEARQLTKHAVAFRDGDQATAAALGLAVSA